jgi:adenosylcobinamide-GDP ribazoletransferase
VDGFGFAVAVLWVLLAASLTATFVSATALLAAAVAALAVTFWMARWLHRRHRGAGTSGGGLGAAQQLAELAVYLGVLTALGHGG